VYFFHDFCYFDGLIDLLVLHELLEGVHRRARMETVEGGSNDDLLDN